ncbi:transcobalamin beta a [Engraulis encrasicolus]|uniref:transcobalamin beta a n=1 Tax=Engraulis encrasicolus TaxID=184585 RepID=UPI002FD0900B
MALKLNSVVCLATLLQLFGWLALAAPLKEVPIKLTVVFDVSDDEAALQLYHTSALPGGSLLGALRRLQHANSDFKFSVTEDPDYGFYLESVNGVAGSHAEHTYWQILAEVHGGELTPIDVGVGCYSPKAYEHITLKLANW